MAKNMEAKNTITQTMRDAKMNKVGLFMATKDEAAPLGFLIGWSKCNRTPTQTVTNVKPGINYTKIAPLDEYNFVEGVRVAKTRLNADVGQVELDIKAAVMNSGRYLPQYRKFLSRCVQYFKPE